MATFKRWVLAHRPTGEVKPTDLELVEEPIPQLAEGEVLVRNIYLSLDPTNRIWMSDREQYMPPVKIGDTMRGGGLGVVERSRSERFPEGQLVNTRLAGWASHAVIHEAALVPVQEIPGVPLTAFTSVLGLTGITAWCGMRLIGQPAAGETVVVSAAAGAVGSIAAQLAKFDGARVVGIAGGKAKCDWLTGECGLDGAIDYKNQDVAVELDRLCPDGIDVNFENVGGAVMEAVYARLNKFGRMPVCGLISSYNDEGSIAGPKDFGNILMRRLTIKGFIVSDYLARFPEALAELVPLVVSGRLKWKTHVVEGIENAPEAVNLMFSGANDGKLLVRVSPDP